MAWGKIWSIFSFKILIYQMLFFDSLKADYRGFEGWFKRKGSNWAFLHRNRNQIDGFLYCKLEREKVDDITPVLYADRIAKIGTFKIDSHGTRLGERFVKKALDYAISEKVDVCYVTIFEKQQGLINLIKKYGFRRYGEKRTVDGTESVYVKNMRRLIGDVVLDYPLVSLHGVKKYLISIYPQYHSAMFPDSILKTESVNILQDITYTNSIHKAYVCRMSNVDKLKRGDILVVYRTASDGPAEYKSVASSICVVEGVKNQDCFNSFDDFYDYTSKYSIFDKTELKKWYEKGSCTVIKMLYNIALSKRLTRHTLIEEIGIPRNGYWGFLRITDEQLKNILKAGGIDESIIVD